jgi:hypothetical protein
MKPVEHAHDHEGWAKVPREGIDARDDAHQESIKRAPRRPVPG